jgi:hypothetical protein
MKKREIQHQNPGPNPHQERVKQCHHYESVAKQLLRNESKRKCAIITNKKSTNLNPERRHR